MRGKASSRVRSGTFLRITPAYAGKSGINCNQIPVTGDHPRLCGEKDTQVTGKPSNRGSPPPMRGKVLFPPFLPQCPEDHPRLCGEKRRNELTVL